MNKSNYFDSQIMEEDIKIDFRKFLYTLWYRKFFLIKIFTAVLLFFIIMTFVSAKKWKVTSDLYINKANSSNYLEINPYAIEEASTLTSMLSSNSNPLANEIELMQSPLVIDRVIQENNLRFKKLFGIFPTKKTGEYITTDKFLKRKIKFENKKGTYVVSISYLSKDKDEAYNVVASIINNYILLHKELNNEKSKTDKQIIESEYQKAKLDLSKKVNAASGLPSTSLSGTGNLAAMSAFSRSAQSAMSTLKGQFIAGEKARVEIAEDANKVAQLSSKLEWAKLVQEMSDSSKVLVIKEPKPLRDWEYASPKLLINIILGIVFGIICSILGLMYKEQKDKKLSYTMLGDNIIYNLNDEFYKFSAEVISNSDKKIAFILFENLPNHITEKFKQFKNTIFLKADISNEFTETINEVDSVVTFASINKTNSETYKLVKKMITNLDKKILYEVLV